MTSMGVGSLLTLGFGYNQSGGDNGNLVSQSIQVGSITNTQSYAYDGVNRLLMAVEGGTAASTGSCPGGVTWCEQYGYDRFGNRFVAGYSGVGEAMATPNTNTTFTNNHISTATYDDAGNESGALGVPGSIVYDQESRQATVKLNASFLGLAESYSYTYDSEGRRVSRSLTPLALTSTYVYDAGGSLAAEYRNGSLQKEFIYGAGRLLEVQDAVQGTSYLSTDHLGSTRLVTNASGNAISRHDYLPFGKEVPVNLGSRNTITGYANPQAGSQPADERVLQRFTGQEDDTETGMQYFHARYYSGAQGRFMSPDPAGILAADPRNPQSWNQYGYALNNPLIFGDPTGMECAYLDDTGTAIEKNGIDHNSSVSECGANGGYWVFGEVNQVSVLDNGDYRFSYFGSDGNGTFSVRTYDSYIAPGDLDQMSLLGSSVVGTLGRNASATNDFLVTFAGASIIAGTVVGGLPALAPETLYHFTTEAGYQGIVEAGQIVPGNGVTGFGVYGTAVPNAATVSWAGIPTEAVVPFSPGLSQVTPGLIPGLWWSVRPVVTTLFQFGVRALLP
jgi:RHS repeat-associated protein